MKKILIVTTAMTATLAGLGISSAFAADMAVKSPMYAKAPMVAPYNWSGFYLGVNVGVGVARDLTGLDSPNTSLNQMPVAYIGPAGAIGGAQVGYNLQYGNWVLGLETDIQGAGMQDDIYCGATCVFPALSSTRISQRLDWFGTTRARVGLATGPVLSYVTGGFAYGGVQTDLVGAFVTPFGPNSFKQTRTGYTLGSGVEASLGGNWTGKIEYLYVNLGTQSIVTHFTGNGGAAGQITGSDIRENIFRVGVNYRIGGNAAYAAMPVANWSGFYIGGNAGSALARNKSNTNIIFPGAASPTFNETYRLMPDGYLGGAQAGYNWQAAAWVFGLEADIQGSTQKDDRSCGLACIPDGSQYIRLDQRMGWLGTARAHVGYSLGSTLFYGTGGLAYGGIKTSVNEMFNGAQIAQAFKHTKTGWTAGAGVETPFELFGLFGKNWTAKTEYLYVDLGTVTDVYTTPGPFTNTLTSHVQEHIFRTGLNYHFNAPVVAKY